MGERGARGHGLRDDLALGNVLGVGVGNRSDGQAGVAQGARGHVLGAADQIGNLFHVDTLGHVEEHGGTLVDRTAPVRVGVGDKARLDIVGEFLLDLGGQAECGEFFLHLVEGAPVGGWHRQVGARAVFGPPPASADAGGDE